MSKCGILPNSLMMLSLTVSECLLLSTSAWGITGGQAPTPCPCAADGSCSPNRASWGYSETRWRPWPGDPTTQTQDESEAPLGDAVELPTLDLPDPGKEDLRGPEKKKKEKAAKKEDETPMSLPGADIFPEIDEDETPMSLPGADIFPEIDNEGFPAFEPQGNQPLGPYQDDAPPALPGSLQQAARQQPAVRRSIARLPANSPKHASTQDSKEE